MLSKTPCNLHQFRLKCEIKNNLVKFGNVTNLNLVSSPIHQDDLDYRELKVELMALGNLRVLN